MNDPRMYRIFMLLGYIVKFIFIIVPILIIVFGTIDLIKCLINQSNSQTNLKLFIKRMINAIIIFFIPTFVSFVLSLIGQDSNNNLLKCFSEPSFCNEILKQESNNCNNSSNKNECCKFILNNNSALYNNDVNECSLPISSLIK